VADLAVEVLADLAVEVLADLAVEVLADLAVEVLADLAAKEREVLEEDHLAAVACLPPAKWSKGRWNKMTRTVTVLCPPKRSRRLMVVFEA
jgi:hypothetical protein